MIFDPLYLLLLAPALILAGIAQMRVRSAYAKASRVPASSGLTGAQAARDILDRNALRNVRIEQSHGTLSDHYDPRQKVLRLSQDVYHGRSLAALGIAAHEAGHALQDAKGYTPLKIRNGIVPLASVGGNGAMLLFFLGLIMNFTGLIYVAIALFSGVVLFQLVNLPVEFDASNRARRILAGTGMIAPREEGQVRKVLSAAALTYVAATLSAILTLLYFVIRAGAARN